jgi:hypothetical protein
LDELYLLLFQVAPVTRFKESFPGLFDIEMGRSTGSFLLAIADQSWGDYYGSFKGKFGVQWMVNYSYPKEK